MIGDAHTTLLFRRYMRTTLVDWLLQVHVRYHMLPETLWVAINIIDRFLSVRVVALQKLQLVGVTSMFIAAKYEEIIAPSVDEFVFMTENGYSKEEILKGERIILSVSRSPRSLPLRKCRPLTRSIADARFQRLQILHSLFVAQAHFQSR